MAEMALLIGAGDDVHRQAGAGQGEGGDDAQRAIEPARLILAFDVAAGEQLEAGARVAAQNVADAVDAGFEADLGHPFHQPMPAAHVVGRKGRAVHAGPEAADLAQRVQVSEEAGGVDLGHVGSLHAGRVGV